jgi:hypothetical protein
LLPDIANRQASGPREFASARFHGACHAAEQGGFSAAVGDEPDPVAGVDQDVVCKRVAVPR